MSYAAPVIKNKGLGKADIESAMRQISPLAAIANERSDGWEVGLGPYVNPDPRPNAYQRHRKKHWFDQDFSGIASTINEEIILSILREDGISRKLLPFKPVITSEYRTPGESIKASKKRSHHSDDFAMDIHLARKKNPLHGRFF